MFQNKNVQMFLWKNVEMFQNKNAEMFPSKNAGVCQNSNVEVFQDSNVPACQDNNAHNSARIYSGVRCVIELQINEKSCDQKTCYFSGEKYTYLNKVSN